MPNLMLHSMQLKLAQVAEHYGETRQFIYRRTEQAFASLGVQLRSITAADAFDADQWPDPHNVKSWSWSRGVVRYKKELKRFEVAVTVDGRLCALAVGLPTRGKITLKVHVIERRPHDNPIKGSVLRIILFAANAYAGMIGSNEVWLCNPVNETMVAKYQQLGYTAVRDRTGSATHMRKDV